MADDGGDVLCLSQGYCLVAYGVGDLGRSMASLLECESRVIRDEAAKQQKGASAENFEETPKRSINSRIRTNDPEVV